MKARIWIIFLGLLILVIPIMILVLLTSPSTDSGPTPADLRPAYREIYLDLVAHAYQNDPNLDLELVLGPGWDGDALESTLQAVLDKTSPSDEGTTARLRNLAAALDVRLTAREGRLTVESDDSTPKWAVPVLAVGFLVFLTIGLLITARFRPTFDRPWTGTPKRSPYRVKPSAWQGEADKPLLQFADSYTFGDDYYDPSFSIDTPESGYLGECGIGISETIDRSKPKTVIAFEVWLFDKSDVQTVSQMLVSEYAYGNRELQSKLARKGALVLARPKQSLKLETTSLRARARVVDMTYRQDEVLPANTLFERLAIEIAIWQTRNQ
jgi:hypothetical protein